MTRIVVMNCNTRLSMTADNPPSPPRALRQLRHRSCDGRVRGTWPRGGAVALAEDLVAMSLTTSKFRPYAAPRPKQRAGRPATRAKGDTDV